MASKCLSHACGHRVSLGFCLDLPRCFQLVESPPEERLALHLCMKLDCEADVVPQHPIATESGNYRADFLVTASLDSALKLVVEVDGHDFHERTKEQAARDKSRDRAMLAAGYHVMRFTGSEVWRDPNRCASEVQSFMRRGT